MTTLTATAPAGLDIDLLNAIRLLMDGVDLAHATGTDADAPTFDALAFAHANDLNQFMATPEASYAIQEHFGEFFAHLLGVPDYNPFWS